MKSYTGKIPFVAESPNTHMTYPYNYYGQQPVWKDNFVFEDTIIFTGLARGGKCSLFEFESVIRPDTRYVMFPTDFDRLLRTHTFVDGVVEGTWTYCKRGSNYGLCLAPQETQ